MGVVSTRLVRTLNPHQLTLLCCRPVDGETGERITPSELESHRRTHDFRAPCCLCALEQGSDYTESRIGLVNIPLKGRGAFLNGEYVAECAMGRCGYFGTLVSSVPGFVAHWYFPYSKFHSKGSIVSSCYMCGARSSEVSELVFNWAHLNLLYLHRATTSCSAGCVYHGLWSKLG
jgi:hypothetical protein